jgi:hypothetical protein
MGDPAYPEAAYSTQTGEEKPETGVVSSNRDDMDDIHGGAAEGNAGASSVSRRS